MRESIQSVLRQKLIDSVAAPVRRVTRRDVWLPSLPGKATVVIGMRRAGKTSLLWQILADRLAAGAPREALVYLSFEDERLVGMDASDLDDMVQAYYHLYPQFRDGPQQVCFFLDEIQLVPGWEVFARRLLDTENVALFLSGSSAKLLSREVATSMRGRALEAVVHPFSWREALRHGGLEPLKPVERLTKAEHSRLDQHLQQYLMHGGFAEAQGLDARHRSALLSSYVDVVLLRDVIERHAVSHPVALRWMVRQLLGNAAGNFSINKFANDLKAQGIAVSKGTLHQYLAHLEDAFLVHNLRLASDSVRQTEVNPRKTYPADMGLIPLFDRSGKANIGHALETAVALELLRRGAELAYAHTPQGWEVDFLARWPDSTTQLVQVCANALNADTLARELRALRDAQAKYPQARLLLIVLDPLPASVLDALQAEADFPLQIILAKQWLLESDHKGHSP